MPKTIGELFNELAIKAGVAADDPKLKALLASPELATIQVDDTLFTQIDSSLLSMKSAKNNHPEIAAVYNSQFYDSMDKALVKIISDADFTPEDIAEINAVPKTRERYALAISKLNEAKRSAKGADKEEINRQLTAAHAAAKAAKDEVETVRNEYEGKIKDIRKTAALKAMFANYKTIYDDLPADIKTATMEALINKAIQDKQSEFRVDEHGNLQLVGKDGSNVFGENHVLLTPQVLLDKTFAPILKVSGPPKPAAPTRQPVSTTPAKGEEAAQANADFVKSHTDKVIAEMAAAPATMI